MFVGKRYHLPTRLRTAAPEIAAEWDGEKNPGHLYPEIVGIGHMQPVWWRCAECDCSYEMSVEKRVVRGGGCPDCAAQSAVEGGGSSASHVLRRPGSAEEGKVMAAPLLPGEMDPSLRPKRTTVFNLRTKY